MSETAFVYAFTVLGGYLAGSVPWAYIIGKINGIDIREHGSGNPGATNVRRTLGKKWGILCFFLDFLKGFLPVTVVNLLISQKIIPELDFAPVAAAVASVAGHMWPIFLKFKGGKGISTIAGILLAVSPLALLASGAVWAVFFYSFRYVSLASIASALFLPPAAWAFSHYGIGAEVRTPSLGMLVFLSALAVLRHKSNIKRLLNGTENKFEKKKKKAENGEEHNENSSTQ